MSPLSMVTRLPQPHAQMRGTLKNSMRYSFHLRPYPRLAALGLVSVVSTFGRGCCGHSPSISSVPHTLHDCGGLIGIRTSRLSFQFLSFNKTPDAIKAPGASVPTIVPVYTRTASRSLNRFLVIIQSYLLDNVTSTHQMLPVPSSPSMHK